MFTRLARRVIHASPWLNLFQDDVRFPNGKVLHDYHIVHFDCEFVACVARTDDGLYALVQQPRYPTGSIEWEIPGGGVEAGENLEAAACREMREETGWESDDHRLIYSFYSMNGSSNQRVHIIACRATKKVGDSDEEITALRWYRLEELRGMIAAKEITDGYTLIGLLLEINRHSSPPPRNP